MARIIWSQFQVPSITIRPISQHSLSIKLHSRLDPRDRWIELPSYNWVTPKIANRVSGFKDMNGAETARFYKLNFRHLQGRSHNRRSSSSSSSNTIFFLGPASKIRLVHTLIYHNVKVKSKGFPYSLPSVRPGADPGVQAVSPQMTIGHPPGGRLPILSARPAVTFPAAEHHRPLAGTKLYCLVTEEQRCEQLAQGCYAALPRAGFEPTTCWSQVQRSTRCATALSQCS